MIRVSEIYTTPPEHFSTPLQQKVYETLLKLDIPFQRVENDPAITMEDCEAIDQALGMKTIKTLLLCNRQQTDFYLFVTRGDKVFRTKYFSAALGISRVSFASGEQLQQYIGTCIGAATVFGALLPSSENVHFVFDEEAVASEWYGCTDGTTTGYMKIRTSDVLEKLLPAAGRTFTVIHIDE